MPVDFKLLFEHHLSPVLDDEGARLQALGRPQDLPVPLHTGNAAQLELEGSHTAAHHHTDNRPCRPPAPSPRSHPATTLGTIELLFLLNYKFNKYKMPPGYEALRFKISFQRDLLAKTAA